MLQFQPPGFGSKFIHTSLGSMVYYTQISDHYYFYIILVEVHLLMNGRKFTQLMRQIIEF
jgi:hypothetical protein